VELDSEAERVLEGLEENVDWACAEPSARNAGTNRRQPRRNSEIRWGKDI
jgi:hypothetical protein